MSVFVCLQAYQQNHASKHYQILHTYACRPWHQPSCGAVTICYRYKLLVLRRTSYFRRHSSTAGSLQRLAQANVGAAPAYLADDCRLLSDVGRRPLPSNSNDMRKLLMPRIHNKLGDMSFSAAGPRLWNDLPPGLRRPGLTFNSFRQSLNTHLFGVATEALLSI